MKSIIECRISIGRSHPFGFRSLQRLLAIVILTGLVGCSFIDGYRSQRPGPSDGIYRSGVLAACPPTPNCVSTLSQTAEQRIVPYTYSKSLTEAQDALKSELLRLGAGEPIKHDGAYIHFELRSGVLRLIDDVEFYFDDATKTVQFRSSSRFGHSDWDQNRKRMEQIRNMVLGRI